MDSPGIPIKEYQIATQVFARPKDFDPRLDSTVRVQTGRLRSKLAEYYAGPGASDQIIVELPKGSYSVVIHERATPGVSGPQPGPPSVPSLSPAPVHNRTRPLFIAICALSATVIVLLLALGGVLLSRRAVPAVTREKPPAVFRTFWHAFLEGPERPWVVFSNAAFVGRPESGMRYFDPHRDQHPDILDHYTGVGEVLGVHELDQLFASLEQGIRVKRGRLLSLDDAKNNDIIFLGSPTENLSLREMPGMQDFQFRLETSKPRTGDLKIVNVRPRPGEANLFWGSPTVPIEEDHAVIGLVPGINSNRFVMILAGTTTIGTQAAVEYVTRAKNVEELVKRAGVKDGGIKPFEAVIKVRVTGGVPVSSELLALHPRS